MFELSQENVSLAASACDKQEAIHLVSRLLTRTGCVDEGYADSMLQREQIAPTYIGKGIAIPHGMPRDRHLVRRTGVVVVQIPAGVDWLQGNKARLVIGIAATADEHLEILSHLSRRLNDNALVHRLVHTENPQDIVTALNAKPPAASAPVIAPPSDRADRFVDVTIKTHHGLHARPAAAIAERARQFESNIIVSHGSRKANGRSLASLLKLGAPQGCQLRIYAIGSDADAALAALKALVDAGDEDSRHPAIATSHGWRPRGSVQRIVGAAASPGLAIGPIHIVRRQKLVIEQTARDPDAERLRLRDAIAEARAELGELQEQVREKTGISSASIFSAYAEFLNDPDLLEQAEAHIASGNSAGWSWQQAVTSEADSLQHVGDALVAARAVDLRDVGTRVLRTLGCTFNENPLNPTTPALLVADDLSPSDVAALDPAMVLGFCTAAGGPTSHAAIIARSLDIPAIAATGPSLLHLPTGVQAVLDGDTGVLYIDPHESDLSSARAARQCLVQMRQTEAAHRHEPAILTDGTRIELSANIGAVAEAEQALHAGAEGVGLLRSEFLFQHRTTTPSEEEQYNAYAAMARALGHRPLVIRTLDIGGDKQSPYVDLPAEQNPFLGVRGIRLCLERPALFKTQLRAIYRAAKHGTIKIMFPMIATLAELQRAREIAEQVRAELNAPPLDIGIMIEIPSAVAMADELAREAAFFSIGTNDLTQYVLAMDRSHPLLARQADGLHPAVLRMIDQTIHAARRHNIPVSVCGGMAGDPLGALLLTGLGVTELSVSIPSIAAIKALLRRISMNDARQLAQRALACASAEEVRRLSAPAQENPQ